ncbi:hypothetical protein OA43_08700 [Klebsiella variicola]|nr:hypothetical protein SE21_08205 [Klebsiella quasipneumoniae]KKY87013.1 hypothetical protein OA43_08700 [Klebsiella variicola]PXL53490.1 hypothetical protein DMS35_17405 [Klebsiella variicola]
MLYLCLLLNMGFLIGLELNILNDILILLLKGSLMKLLNVVISKAYGGTISLMMEIKLVIQNIIMVY